MTSALAHLKEIYDHLKWADEQVLAAAETVSDEGFRREQNISLGSIHKLLVHAVSAQHLWLARWQGETVLKALEPADYPTPADIRRMWDDVHSRIAAFLAKQTDASLEAAIRFRRGEREYVMPLRHLIAHTFDHGTYHRGQLNSMITLAGGKPVEAGFLAFQRMRTGQP